MDPYNLNEDKKHSDDAIESDGDVPPVLPDGPVSREDKVD